MYRHAHAHVRGPETNIEVFGTWAWRGGHGHPGVERKKVLQEPTDLPGRQLATSGQLVESLARIDLMGTMWTMGLPSILRGGDDE